ncbi:MAG: PQQ-binding-like beta-propeller repeat protein, partial [Psychrosphaera sp.]|nr:PQQ-binding-like beta-propeller repeat protein [Psychrosphaera sp.]
GLDLDGDGLTNFQELLNGTSASDASSTPGVGGLRWQVTLPNTLAHGSATASDGTSYFVDSKQQLISIDRQGQVKWQVIVDLPLTEKPVVAADGTIYVTGFDDNPQMGAVFAYSKLGNLLWSYSHEPAQLFKPALRQDGGLIVADGLGYLHHLDTQGNLVWQVQFRQSDEPVVRVPGQPVVGRDNTSYLHNGAVYIAIDKAGEILWELDLGYNNPGALALDYEGSIYAIARHTLYAITPNGTLKWEAISGDGNYHFEGDGVIDSTGSIVVSSSVGLFRFAANGERLTGFEWQSGSSRMSGLSVAFDDLFYGYAQDSNGNDVLQVLDAQGNSRWFRVLTDKPLDNVSMVSNDTLLVASRNGQVRGIISDVAPSVHSAWPTEGNNQHNSNLLSEPDASRDYDKDGTPNGEDNCPFTFNPAQINSDGAADGGDLCDADDDNDGVPDTEDAFASDSSESVDSDNDGLGDNADNDDDNDGVADADDAFEHDKTEWLDSDGDGIGNVADTDDDNDGMADAWEIANGFDPLNPDDAALDSDGDGFSNLDEFTNKTDPNDKRSKPNSAGSVIWQYQLQEADHSLEYFALDITIGDDKRLYLADRSGNIRIINADGSLALDEQIDQNITDSVVVDESGTFYICDQSGYLRAYQPGGEPKWVFEGQRYCHRPAIGRDGTIYFATQGKLLLALDKDGNEKWRFESSTSITNNLVVGANDVIYFTIDSANGNSAKIQAVSPDGEALWQYDLGSS